MGNIVLKISDLVVDYGIIRAIKGIDLEIEKGKIVAILGANGAGKSSVIRTINGLVKPKSGKIIFEDENISGLNPHKIAKKGIIQSPEGRHIFKGLTVEENLMVGAYSLKAEKGESTKKLKQQILDQVYTYFPVLKERRKQQASTLSGGEQQMLAIGRALMAKPKLLLLDEPSLGLAPMIVKDIFKIITEIKAAGNTILLVEQNAFQTLKIADEVYVMELGKIKTKGTAEELLQDEQLVEAYLGKK
ncbi:MAG: ABC transporter ATP-binding protein [Candidatus Izemoplasmatales bacterium]|jgi:branched-chain amino acid transport system ATP-binding protein|nr:ABC transporter ATP-binding protein [Candidatus Izemoplasmatales bacterium]